MIPLKMIIDRKTGARAYDPTEVQKYMDAMDKGQKWSIWWNLQPKDVINKKNAVKLGDIERFLQSE